MSPDHFKWVVWRNMGMGVGEDKAGEVNQGGHHSQIREDHPNGFNKQVWSHRGSDSVLGSWDIVHTFRSSYVKRQTIRK